MTQRKAIFTISCEGKDSLRSYTVLGDDETTMETVWLSQKCWFMPGTRVEITDDKGNSKIFVKE